jgi:hypothetical protein
MPWGLRRQSAQVELPKIVVRELAPNSHLVCVHGSSLPYRHFLFGLSMSPNQVHGWSPLCVPSQHALRAASAHTTISQPQKTARRAHAIKRKQFPFRSAQSSFGTMLIATTISMERRAEPPVLGAKAARRLPLLAGQRTKKRPQWCVRNRLGRDATSFFASSSWSCVGLPDTALSDRHRVCLMTACPDNGHGSPSHDSPR